MSAEENEVMAELERTRELLRRQMEDNARLHADIRRLSETQSAFEAGRDTDLLRRAGELGIREIRLIFGEGEEA